MRYFMMISLALAVAGCSTPSVTLYADATSAIQMNDKMYLIEASGNDDTSQKRIEIYALLRAADVCLENDFISFALVSEIARTEEISEVVSPPLFLNCITGVCFASGGGKVTTEKAHNSSIRVLFYKTGEKQREDAFDCQLIEQQLSEYRQPPPKKKQRTYNRYR